MASASSDQENGLLPSDEGGPSPPPARRLPIKALLAVGLCAAAAAFAGAAVVAAPATRAPAEHRFPWALVRLQGGDADAWKKYLTEECHDLLAALEEEAGEEERKHESRPGEEADCKDSEQTCTLSFTGETMGNVSMQKCFPTSCQQKNILKGIEEDMTTNAGGHFSNLSVACE